MIYFPETINTMNTMSLRIFTHFLLEGYARQLTLCMLAFWSHEGAVFLPSPHLVTSFHLPCLGSTDAHCPRLGGPGPFTSKMAPLSTGSAHTPLPGFRTNMKNLRFKIKKSKKLLLVIFLINIADSSPTYAFSNHHMPCSPSQSHKTVPLKFMFQNRESDDQRSGERC